MMLYDLVVGWWKGELRRLEYPTIELGQLVTVPQVVEALAPYHSGARHNQT